MARRWNDSPLLSILMKSLRRKDLGEHYFSAIHIPTHMRPYT